MESAEGSKAHRESTLLKTDSQIAVKTKNQIRTLADLTQTVVDTTPGRQQPTEDGEAEAGEVVALEEADLLASGASRGNAIYL